MKLLLIGSEGSIGRRYRVILEHLGVDFEEYDNPEHKFFGVEQSFYKRFTHAIIATPTHTHLDWIDELPPIWKLVEKPASKDLEGLEQRKLNHGCFVVNNYQFLPSANTRRKITYNFYNTGRDGLIWDVCQLVYIAYKNKVELEVKTDSFWWDLKWGMHQIAYHEIERSYYHMLKAFCSGDTSNLWDLKEATTMSEVCRHLYSIGGDCVHFIYRPKGSCAHTSQDGFIAFSRQSAGEDRRANPAPVGLSIVRRSRENAKSRENKS